MKNMMVTLALILDNLSDELSKRAETIVVKIRDKAYDESGD